MAAWISSSRLPASPDNSMPLRRRPPISSVTCIPPAGRIAPASRITAACQMLVLLLLCFTAQPSNGAQQESRDGERLEFFEKRIRPLFVQHCYECHSADSKKIGGGLRLDNRSSIAKGGDSGAVVESGKPDLSLLIRAVRYTDEAVQMPPKGKLTAAQINDLETWVRDGAVDPRAGDDTDPSAESWDATFASRARWWSLQPVVRPPLPANRQPAELLNPVDQFIQSAQESAGLTSAVPADAQTLIRRLSLVLTGLPPNAEMIEQFAERIDRTEPARTEAVAELVDDLLQSPHFGEHWARHWMDVVRYSETHGNEWNYEVHHAWRYRDYLIRAFNDDVPFDQLIREHIAGDLLPTPRLNQAEQFNESVIGTGFYRFGEVNHDDCITLRSIGYDLADNQIDTLTKAFQATTVACARCHDHKFDAISAADYYGMLAVLRSSRQVSHAIDSPSVNADALEQLRRIKTRLVMELAGQWKNDADRLAANLQSADPPAAWKSLITGAKLPQEDLFHVWQTMAAQTESTFAEAWTALGDQFQSTDRERTEFNLREFQSFADFRHGAESRQQVSDNWQIGGQGLREPPSLSGELLLHTDGPAIIQSVLPAGWYTNALSDRSNGTLRSAVLPAGPKQISFQVMGLRSSAVRLVSNNCQLNYANYRALISADPQWITFAIPGDREELRTYAELMTMFDNPKFPDQLSALGGDTANYKVPWETAAANPRSWFGITQVVLHDSPQPPRAEISHQRRLFADPPPKNLNELAVRYASITTDAIQAWADHRATDDDARWLSGLVRHELLNNQTAVSPAIAQLVQEFREIESRLSVPRVSVGVADSGSSIRQPIFVRGDCALPGPAVDRRFPEVLSTASEQISDAASGRLQMAEQIASANNPLTARVFVNRVWHHLFGTGIVRTVDDFGHVGELPSHPELLDYLAADFMHHHWSLKSVIRSIVLSRTFQTSHESSDEAGKTDPRNRLLTHFPARRLEAENIRDAILAASGSLDRTLGGPSIHPWREKEYADRRLFPGPLDGDCRRSLYIRSNLMEAPRFLEAFNLPGGKVTQGRRDQTNVPAQALALLNDPFVLQQADEWAGALLTDSGQPRETVESRIDHMFRRALSRPPRAEELQQLRDSVTQLAELHGADVEVAGVLASRQVWRDMAHIFFNLSEFIYIP